MPFVGFTHQFPGMKQFSSLILLLSILLLLLPSCEWINPEEDIPSYIRIDSVGFTPGLATEAGTISNINDVWVYVDGILQGVYEIPAFFPVLATGEHEIMFKAGIKKNGISASREAYPFYASVKKTVDLKELETSVFYPVFTYRSETQFPWIENFEDAGMTLDSSMSSQVPLVQLKESENSFGSMNLTGNQIKAECSTLNWINLPQNSPVYLEMEYRNSINLTLGLLIDNPGEVISTGIITLYPKETWTKIYIDLTYYATTYTDAEGFKIFLGTIKSDSTTTESIQFDNFKLVHF
jgi:hypothetical protein